MQERLKRPDLVIADEVTFQIEDKIDQLLSAAKGFGRNNLRFRTFSVESDTLLQHLLLNARIKARMQLLLPRSLLEPLAHLVVGMADSWEDDIWEYHDCRFIQLQFRKLKAPQGAAFVCAFVFSQDKIPEIHFFEELPYLSVLPNYGRFLPPRLSTLGMQARIQEVTLFNNFLDWATANY